VSLASVGVVVWLAVVGRPVPVEVVAPPAPVHVVVEGVEFAHNRSAVLRGRVERGEEVLASGAQGLVTSIEVAPGDRLATGVLAYRVDGLGVWVYKAASPLYRPIGVGARGRDVRIVQRFLARALDVEVEVDGVFDWRMRDLARAWQKREGLEQDGVVDPARFLRVAEPLTVAEVALRVGAPAPALGESVIVGTSELGSLEVTADGGGEVGTAYRFFVPGAEMEVGWDGQGWVVSEDHRGTALILLEAAAAQMGEFEGPAELTGRLELVTPAPAAAMPAGALMDSASSPAGCVWLLDDSGGWERVEGVAALGQTASGAVATDAVATVGREVLLEPQAHVGAGQCP
jgi:hypothetical protein